MQRLIDIYKDQLNYRLNFKNGTLDSPVEHTESELLTEYAELKAENVKSSIKFLTQRLGEHYISTWDENQDYNSQVWDFELINENKELERQNLRDRIAELEELKLTEESQDVIDGYDEAILSLNESLDLILDIQYAKPTFLELEAEWEAWQIELDDERLAREAEEARVEAIKERWNACMLNDMHGVWSHTGKPHVANPALLLKDIIENDDILLLEELESAFVANEAKALALKAVRDIEQKGARKKSDCETLLNIVRGVNSDTKTEEEVDAMEVAFESILKALQNGRPTKAKKLIELVDDATVTDLKTMLLSKLTELGY